MLDGLPWPWSSVRGVRLGAVVPPSLPGTTRGSGVTPTAEQVQEVVGTQPLSIGDIGLAVVAAAGAATGEDGAPVGQRLAAAGLSLSALQRLVDGMVRDGLVEEVRGMALWDRGLPTAGTKARGRYYLAVAR